MPFDLPLPEPWSSRGWQAKIYDKEGPEEPHVTVRFRAARAWRFSLRSGDFLDREPPARDVPKAVVDALRENLADLVAAWDQMFPSNVVQSPEPNEADVPPKPKGKMPKKPQQSRKKKQ
jgi:hypothetical protein